MVSIVSLCKEYQHKPNLCESIHVIHLYHAYTIDCFLKLCIVDGNLEGWDWWETFLHVDNCSHQNIIISWNYSCPNHQFEVIHFHLLGIWSKYIWRETSLLATVFGGCQRAWVIMVDRHLRSLLTSFGMRGFQSGSSSGTVIYQI